MNHYKRLQAAYQNSAFCEAIDSALIGRLQWLDDSSCYGFNKEDFVEAIDKALSPLLEDPTEEEKRQARDDQMADDAWDEHRNGCP